MAEPSPIPGVGAVVLDGDRILLVQRGGEHGQGLWAVPGGRVEWGESWRDAARREVLEETGLEVVVGDVVWVGEAMGPDHHFAIVDFHATPISGTVRAGSDALDARWVSLKEAIELPMPQSMQSLIMAVSKAREESP